MNAPPDHYEIEARSDVVKGFEEWETWNCWSEYETQEAARMAICLLREDHPNHDFRIVAVWRVTKVVGPLERTQEAA